MGVADGKAKLPPLWGCGANVPCEVGERVDQLCLQQVHGQRVGGEVEQRDSRLKAIRLDRDREELVDRVVDQHRGGQLGLRQTIDGGIEQLALQQRNRYRRSRRRDELEMLG
jgi:hypothetical protein